MSSEYSNHYSFRSKQLRRISDDDVSGNSLSSSSSEVVQIPVGREYECTICKKTEHSASAIQRHVTSRHMTLHLYKCPQCSFNHRSNAETVRRHMAKMHNGMQDDVIDCSSQYRDEINAKIAVCFPSFNEETNDGMYEVLLMPNYS